MSAHEIAGSALPSSVSPRPPAARYVAVIGLTLALGYLIILGGT